jgi:hypothetical protein
VPGFPDEAGLDEAGLDGLDGRGGPAAAGQAAGELAEVIRADERLVPLFLPLGEGLLAAVKRG